MRSASARRSVPTCGSTTATCTPTGMYGQRVAQHERALAHGVAGDAVGDVDDLAPRGGSTRITPWQTPTKSSSRP